MTGKTNAGSGAQVFYLGTGTSFDVSNVPGYQNLTEDNFIVGMTSATCKSDGWIGKFNRYVGKTYDASTGKLTISVTGDISYSVGDSGTVTNPTFAYLVKGNIK